MRTLLPTFSERWGESCIIFRRMVDFDFLIRYRGECCPVEGKARTGNAKSLQTVLKNPDHYHVCHAIKLGDYNVGRNGQVLTIPFYMAFLLTEV